MKRICLLEGCTSKAENLAAGKPKKWFRQLLLLALLDAEREHAATLFGQPTIKKRRPAQKRYDDTLRSLSRSHGEVIRRPS
jgi:hypothetical protein